MTLFLLRQNYIVNFIDTNGKRKEAVSKSATDSCRREKYRVKFASFDLEMLFFFFQKQLCVIETIGGEVQCSGTGSNLL